MTLQYLGAHVTRTTHLSCWFYWPQESGQCWTTTLWRWKFLPEQKVQEQGFMARSTYPGSRSSARSGNDVTGVDAIQISVGRQGAPGPFHILCG